MRLASGEKLGAYEILDTLGVGGMGEVYRGRDTRLEREVAIKVLPEAFATEGERVARFEREAKLLAALNHPGIATVYGPEEAQGKRFLVMELVEGETLADRIDRGAIPYDDAIPLFHQVAEALEAAHEKGVVHRDLKPANIQVTPEGKVKILDFGLAKLVEPEPLAPDASRSQSPTLAQGTLHGVILGTASYMSPEQARGLGVDRRCDIWAFGCCLYEALTGKKAFDGQTVTDVLAAVVKSEPDWSRLPKDIPWTVRKLVGRCLRKDPAKRLRDISAARLDIEDGEISPPPAQRTRLGWKLAFLIGVLVGSLLVGTLLWRRVPPSPPRVQRFAVQVPVDDFSEISLAPDGDAMTFVGSGGRLGIRRFEDLEARFIEAAGYVRQPFFSPDGQWIGFFAGGELKKVSLAGGSPVLLSRTQFADQASWSVNGFIYVAAGERILKIPDAGGAAELVTASSDSERGFRWPHALPDGRSLLVTSHSASFESPAVELVSIATGERKALISAAARPRYFPGHIVFARDGSLFAVPFDIDRLTVTGTPIPVLEGVRSLEGLYVDFDVSPAGTLVYKPAADIRNRLVWVDRSGKTTPLAESEPGRQFSFGPRLSPDGSRVAVPRRGRGGLDVWVLEIARGTLSRVTFEGGNRGPLWSPDGKNLFFSSNRAGGVGLFSAPADGRGTAQQHTTGALRSPTSITSDGRILLFRQMGEGWDIGMIRLDGNDEPELLLKSRFNEHSAMLSPDDRWFAYVSDESGRDEVYVVSFPDLGLREQVSNEGGTEPLWSRDGRELYYRKDDKVLAVSVQTNPSLVIGRPSLLFAGPYELSLIGGWNYDVAPDGRFLMIDSPAGGAPATVNVTLNWLEELRRISPN